MPQRPRFSGIASASSCSLPCVLHGDCATCRGAAQMTKASAAAKHNLVASFFHILLRHFICLFYPCL